MAAARALTAAFVRIGFNQDAADTLTDPAGQGIVLNTLVNFGDDECRTLCQTLRKPGGTILIPAAAGAPAQRVPNPGVAVSAQAEINLKTACFMARHYDRIDRDLTAAEITAQAMVRFNVYRRDQAEYKEPSVLLKLKKGDKMVRWFEAFADHLHLYNGSDGRPLSYIIRDVAAVPLAAHDPAFGDPGSRYTTLRDEIRCRASHIGERFALDNARVLSLIRESLEDFEHVLTWMHGQVAAQNGRGAWLALRSHYLGTTELETIEVLAEKSLDTHVYRGEKPRYSFEYHVSIHRRAHLDIEHTTNVPLTEQVKVRKLLKSLQASSLTTAIATIRANAHLRNSFDEAVNFIRAYITTTTDTDARTISQVNNDGSNKKQKKQKVNKKKSKVKNKDKDTKDVDNKSIDRYYKPNEWRKLSQETRDKVLAMRAKKKRVVSEVSKSDDASTTKESSDDDSNGNDVTQRKVKFFRRSDSSDEESNHDDDEE